MHVVTSCASMALCVYQRTCMCVCSVVAHPGCDVKVSSGRSVWRVVHWRSDAVFD